MITLLLIIIYTAFIGLGLPHSVIGAAWPAIHTDLGLTIDAANYVTVLISGSTVVASVLGSRLANKFGTYAVVATGISLTALSLLGFSFSSSIVVMCLCAVPLGLASGAIDFSLNNFISLNYSAMHANFLHCFYGVGIMASPYIMSIMLDSTGWRAGYRVIFILQCVIALVVIFSRPLWKLKGIKENAEEDEVKPENLSYLKMFKTPSILLIWIVCIAANAIEGVAGIWTGSYLVYGHNYSEAQAAKIITLFYIGIALGRFLSGILSVKISSWRLIIIGTGFMTASVVLMMLPFESAVVLGVFLLGLGNGPIYPNLIYLTPKHFGEKYSGSVVSSEIAAAYLGFTVAPPIFGYIAKSAASTFPIYVGAWIVVFVAASFFFLKKTGYFKKI